jgi:thiol-disulfide isomerase/thioredoxin
MNYNTKNPSLVLVKAEWCGHCRNFKPVWEQLQHKIPQDKMNVVTLDSEADKQFISRIKTLNGFPSLYFVPPKGKGTAMMYGGSRDFVSVVDYVNAALGHELIKI